MENKIKILAIDDNDDILYAISEICKVKDWEPITATTGMEGIDKFTKEKPDLVLVDYHLPKLDGIEVVRRLRKISKHVPIVVLTVEESQKIADKFMKAGASDFALKPIKAPDLIARIGVHLRLNEENKIDRLGIEKVKGISRKTLELVIEDLKSADDYTSVMEISKRTGLAHQTIYRYVQFLTEKNKLDIEYYYGGRGRPETQYKWKNNFI